MDRKLPWIPQNPSRHRQKNNEAQEDPAMGNNTENVQDKPLRYGEGAHGTAGRQKDHFAAGH